MAPALAREVADASKALENELPARTVKTGRADFLVDTAKRLQRLQTKRSKLRKEIKRVDEEIRLRKRELKALAHLIGTGQ